MRHKYFIAFLLLIFWGTSNLTISAENNSDPTDVTKDSWGYGSIRTALETGYISLFPDGSFRPQDVVTGLEFSNMLVKALQLRGDQRFLSDYSGITNFSTKIFKNKHNRPLKKGDMAQLLTYATNYVFIDKRLFQYKNEWDSLPSTFNYKDVVDRLSHYNHESMTMTKWIESFYDFISKPLEADEQNMLLTGGREIRIYCGKKCFTEEQYYTQQYLEPLIRKKDEIESIYEGNATYNQRIYESVKRGLISGSQNGELELDSAITRTQAVVSIEKVLKFHQNEPLTVNKYALSKAEVLWHRTNLFSVWSNFTTSKYDKNGNKIATIDEPEYAFDSSLFQVETPDKKYATELTGLYVIDLDDPKDPFRTFIKEPLSDLYWSPWGADLNFSAGKKNGKFYEIVKEKYPISKVKNAYLIIYTQKELKNNYKKNYSEEGSLRISGIGEYTRSIHNISGNTTSLDIDEGQFNRVINGSLEVMSGVYTTYFHETKYSIKEYLNYAGADIFIVPKKTTAEQDFRIDWTVWNAGNGGMPNSNRLYDNIVFIDPDATFRDEPQITVYLN